MQRGGVDLYFVRASEKMFLFERIEVLFAGREEELILPCMSLAAVATVRTQFKGLLVHGSLSELGNDPDRKGRVRFASPTEVSPWIERLAHVAPAKVRAFAHERGDELLRQTDAARTLAQDACARFIEPLYSKGLQAVIDAASDEQRAIVANLTTRPYVIGSQDLRLEYTAAVTALVMAGDRDLTHLGQVALLPLRGLGLIYQKREVVHEVIWRIRLLTDAIVRRRADA